MRPEERLDLLLSQRQSGDAAATNEDTTTSSTGMTPSSDAHKRDEASEPATLLAADRFAVWGNAEPAPAFADRLEAQLLARFALPAVDLQQEAVIQSDAPARRERNRHAPIPAGNSPGTSHQHSVDSGNSQQLYGRSVGQDQQTDTSPERTPRAPLSLVPRQLRSIHISSRLLRQSVAAAVLLIVGSGVLAAAALGAGPGQPLYGVHRLEQGAWTTLATSPDERVRLHVQYAQEALNAFDAAVAQHASDQADRDALTTFEQEMQAAADGIAGLPAGNSRTALTAQLASLHTRGEQDLLAALPKLDWALRAEVTVAIGQLGVSVPHVNQASIAGANHNGNYVWTVTVTGSGFAPGAVLLIDGRPVGTAVSHSSTQLVVQVDSNQLSDGVHTVGVGNPDGTVSIVSGINSHRVPDDHGGSSGSGGSSSGSGHDGSGGSGGSGGGSSGGGGSTGGGGSGSGSGSGDGGGDHGGSGGSATPTPTPSPTATPGDGGH